MQTSSTGSMQVESSDTSLTSNTDMHDIVEKYVIYITKSIHRILQIYSKIVNIFIHFGFPIDLMILISALTIYTYYAICFICRLSMDRGHYRL